MRRQTCVAAVVGLLLVGCAPTASRAQEPRQTQSPASTKPPTPPAPTLPPGHPPLQQTKESPVNEATAHRRVLGDVILSDGTGYLVATTPGQPTKQSYLGVNTSSAPPALQKQLQLKSGVGLVVDSVEPDSPAAKAGVKEFDVLHKLDDQLLINTEQLSVLVRSFDAGREVKLTVIREGKPQTLTATLAERVRPPMRLTLTRPPGTTIGWDREAAVALSPALTRVRTPGGESLFVVDPVSRSQLKASRLTVESPLHKITISSPNGRKHLKAEDLSGKTLFEGPVETAKDLEKIPKELRDVCKELLRDVIKEPENAKAIDPLTRPAR